MKTIEITLYNFLELDEKAKKRAYREALPNIDYWFIEWEWQKTWEDFTDIFDIRENRGHWRVWGYGENTDTWSFQKVRRHFIENWPSIGNYKTTKSPEKPENMNYEMGCLFKFLSCALRKKENESLDDIICEIRREFEKEVQEAIDDYCSYDTWSENMEWDGETYFLENGTEYIED